MHDLSHAMSILSRIGAACFISKTCKIGIPSRIRTGVDGVKIHYPRPLDDGDIMAEAVRFELTGPVGPSDFKSGALNRALPHFHVIVKGLHKCRCHRTFATSLDSRNPTSYSPPG